MRTAAASACGCPTADLAFRYDHRASLPRSDLVRMARRAPPGNPRKVPDVTDPPLDVDELPGWLDAWQYRPEGWQGSPGGWFGQVWYSYPREDFSLFRLLEAGMLVSEACQVRAKRLARARDHRRPADENVVDATQGPANSRSARHLRLLLHHGDTGPARDPSAVRSRCHPGTMPPTLANGTP